MRQPTELQLILHTFFPSKFRVYKNTLAVGDVVCSIVLAFTECIQFCILEWWLRACVHSYLLCLCLERPNRITISCIHYHHLETFFDHLQFRGKMIWSMVNKVTHVIRCIHLLPIYTVWYAFIRPYARRASVCICCVIQLNCENFKWALLSCAIVYNIP